MRRHLLCVLLAGALGAGACTNLDIVRLQPEAIDVGPGLRPVAGIQANAASWYFLFIPIPGVNLDQVVNQMLVVAAKTMGADKVTNLTFEMTPDGGVWALRKLFLWRGARASGIAVQITALPDDPGEKDGPEPAAAPPPPGK